MKRRKAIKAYMAMKREAEYYKLRGITSFRRFPKVSKAVVCFAIVAGLVAFGLVVSVWV